MSLVVVLSAVVLLTGSGFVGLLCPGRHGAGQFRANVFVQFAAGIGLVGAGMALIGGRQDHFSLPEFAPWGAMSLGLDALSAWFLVPVFLIPSLGSIYGLGYWRESEHAETGNKLRLFYGILAGSMAMVALARDGVAFLMAWEVMALSAFFLVTTEDTDPDACRAGWVYLLATHVGTLCLAAMFALIRSATGSFSIGMVASLPPATATAVFILAVAGFGLKAGIVPFHVWLPGAHANAPTHVSAILSGVMLKMGIYGIARIAGLLPNPSASWGVALLVLGATSGLLGVVFAIGQHDIKRLLAYHSIENIGIILMGLGLAMVGRSLHHPIWIVLGLGGALLHCWNHGLFKSLLFFSAGSVIHAVGTRQIDRMGGLAKRMPLTAAFFLTGATAICGLPPLNGLISELLIYLGLFRTIGSAGGNGFFAAAFVAPILAMIGALAVACFVKVFGAAFLGEPREVPTDDGHTTDPHPTGNVRPTPHEAPKTMLVPMGVLAGCCLVIGLAPWSVAPLLDRAAGTWTSTGGASLPTVGSLVPLGWISIIGSLLILGGVTLTLWLTRKMQASDFRTVGTWDCGYAAPTPRMQYTASSFGQILVDLFGWMSRPRVHRPRLKGPFPTPQHFESHVDDTILRTAVEPAYRAVEAILLRFRVLQQGRIQLYILYIVAITVLLLTFALSKAGRLG